MGFPLFLAISDIFPREDRNPRPIVKAAIAANQKTGGVVARHSADPGANLGRPCQENNCHTRHADYPEIKPVTARCFSDRRFHPFGQRKTADRHPVKNVRLLAQLLAVYLPISVNDPGKVSQIRTY